MQQHINATKEIISLCLSNDFQKTVLIFREIIIIYQDACDLSLKFRN